MTGKWRSEQHDISERTAAAGWSAQDEHHSLKVPGYLGAAQQLPGSSQRHGVLQQRSFCWAVTLMLHLQALFCVHPERWAARVTANDWTVFGHFWGSPCPDEETLFQPAMCVCPQESSVTRVMLRHHLLLSLSQGPEPQSSTEFGIESTCWHNPDLHLADGETDFYGRHQRSHEASRAELRPGTTCPNMLVLFL